MQAAQNENTKWVQLTDEQFQALKMLMPGIAMSETKTAPKQEKSKKPKSRYRLQIEAEFKKRYPFS